MKLRGALRAMLGDIPASWGKVLDGMALNWQSRILDREMHADEIIVPGKRNLFRAFKDLEPGRVRAVILGQDPYPNPDWATGRAFEQGNLTKWPDNPRGVAASLRRMVQAIVSARTGNHSYSKNDRAWGRLIDDARSRQFRLEKPGRFFDRLNREGVLFLNASLTVSVINRPGSRKECTRHFQFWAPLIDRVLSFLAGRKRGHVVFLLFGRHAAGIFERSGAKAAAERTGNWRTRVDMVHHFHPAAITSEGPAFLQPPNPFCAANAALQRMGAKPLRWSL